MSSGIDQDLIDMDLDEDCYDFYGYTDENPYDDGCGEDDLSDIDFTGADFSGENLSGVNFTGSNLRETNLSNTDLVGVCFNDAILTGAFFNEEEFSVTLV